VAAFDSTGTLLRVRRLVQWPQTGSGEVISPQGSVASGSGKPLHGPSRQEGMPNRLVPVVEWMEVGPEGEMWIRDPTRLQDSTAKWTCIDRGGTPRASVLFRSRPFAASTSVMGIGK